MRRILASAAIAVVLSSVPLAAAPAKSTDPRHGRLRVVGTKLCGSSGEPVQLKGMSTMGLQWYGGVVNADAFDALAFDWNVDVVRLALYVGEGGYASRPALKDVLIKGIDLAIERGLYVIVDWHVLSPGDPNDPVYSGALAFFRDISSRYAAYPHIIYEIMNEPNGSVSWAKDLKPYAERMVAAIRENDPENVILIGSGGWSQNVDVAASDPVKGTNLMYTVHFYAGSHGFVLRYKIQAAIDAGAAVFCSEWGTSDASGSGGPFLKETDEWLSFLDGLGISWVNWSLCDKGESSAALKTGRGMSALVPSGKAWTADELTVSGAYVRAKIRGGEAPRAPAP